MVIYHLREAYLEQLKLDIAKNIELYKEDEPWIDKYFENGGWYLQTNISVEDIDLIETKGASGHNDIENTKKLYNGLKMLKVTQASDERLWAYLTHFTFWDYMRTRWPVESYIEKENPAGNLRERYFFVSDRGRALIRNGISRLWWYGHISYDEKRDNPFELTEVLLSNLDITQQLVERSFSRNIKISRAILSVLAELKQDGNTFPNREQFRNLMRFFNRMGGVTVLDTLQEEEIKNIAFDKIRNYKNNQKQKPVEKKAKAKSKWKFPWQRNLK